MRCIDDVVTTLTQGVPLLNDTLPQDDCDNPSPWVHPNGTFFLACGRQIKGNYIHLWRSENIWGPWINVSEMRPPNMAPSGPPGKWEDEFVYTGTSILQPPFLVQDETKWHG